MADPTRPPGDESPPPVPPVPPVPPAPPAPAAPPSAASADDQLPWLEELPPRKIVAGLDRYIVGAEGAEKAGALALRKPWPGGPAPAHLRAEMLAHNILLIR